MYTNESHAFAYVYGTKPEQPTEYTAAEVDALKSVPASVLFF